MSSIGSAFKNAFNIFFKVNLTGSIRRLLSDLLTERVSLKDFGAVGDGVTSAVTAIANASASGVPVFVPAGTYAVSGAVTLLGDWRFAKGAKLKCTAETLITADGDLHAKNLEIDGNSYPVAGHLLYLKSGTHRLKNPKIYSIKGDGRGAYAIKVNIEGCDTEIDTPVFNQITDARSGAITGEEGFCGGIYATTHAGSTMTAEGSRIIIKTVKGNSIYTTQADGVTENTSDYDADCVRFFVNDVASGAYIDTVYILVDGVDVKDVQKRAVKVSGVGHAEVKNVKARGTRAGTQMSDVVFVADSRLVTVENIKGYGKFDNVVKLDGSTFDALYDVKGAKSYSSQAGIGCALFASDCANVKATGLQAVGECERIARLSNCDSADVEIIYKGSTATTKPLVDAQNCDIVNVKGNVNATFTGASAQYVYAISCNKVIVDGNIVTSFGTAGQAVRWDTCNDFILKGHVESNKYTLFGSGTNGHVSIDARIKQTAAAASIDISGTDYLKIDADFSGDFSGANVTAVSISGADHLDMRGKYEFLNMTDASGDRGILLTSCTKYQVEIETITGGSDVESVRLSSCADGFVRLISDSSKPLRQLNTCTNLKLICYAPALPTLDASGEVTQVSVQVW